MVKEKLFTRIMKATKVEATVIRTAGDGTKRVETLELLLPGECSNEKKTADLIKSQIAPDELYVTHEVKEVAEEKRAITESVFLEMSFVVE